MGQFRVDTEGFIVYHRLHLPCEHSLLSYLTFVGLAAQHFTRLLSEIYDGSQMAAANELTICFGIRLHLFGTITNIKP